ncbi:DUF3240 family protein [Methylophaga sulfidovorans]|uniref:DUF3240 domain-containing protein n=1 Tax=Methylophaga sulfidovorans TaxID=45496 RepID=A0A1I3ZDB1_9GAMM|nr:DUF3240 family protein [Methylophaga sulfidovorans]SFK41569.1 Protein of unknown function [Methylophaga sulfidovorans]
MTCLLALIVKPTLEAAISDWLLLHPSIDGFTSQQASGHGSGHPMSITEQVAGQRQQLIYWLELDAEVVKTILDELAASFSGADIRYWQLPLAASGLIR